ncbi:MAG: hypothetical protein J3R72DRAFT_463137 [Linnemannia gamsii]|nr:MAG: hypothetical protein J3R72DRAFT_463137 [Linnemannia gamsii]
MPPSHGKDDLLALSGLLYLVYTDVTVTYSLLTDDFDNTASGVSNFLEAICLYLASAVALLSGVVSVFADAAALTLASISIMPSI